MTYLVLVAGRKVAEYATKSAAHTAAKLLRAGGRDAYVFERSFAVKYGLWRAGEPE